MSDRHGDPQMPDRKLGVPDSWNQINAESDARLLEANWQRWLAGHDDEPMGNGDESDDSENESGDCTEPEKPMSHESPKGTPQEARECL